MRFQSLLLFSLFSLPFVAPSPLEALTVQDGPVKSTNSWSYDDCGESPLCDELAGAVMLRGNLG
jgi:hypothetical protein